MKLYVWRTSFVDCNADTFRPHGLVICRYLTKQPIIHLRISKGTLYQQFMAVSKFPNHKFIVVNIKIFGFENTQVCKVISFPIRKTHSFIRRFLHDEVSVHRCDYEYSGRGYKAMICGLSVKNDRSQIIERRR